MAKPISPTRHRLMTQPGDPWYIRFPDGRVIRAANTTVLRRHLDLGRIPYSSTVRRSEEEEWVKLEWMEEFADIIKKPAPVNGVKKAPSPKKKKKRRPVAAGAPSSAGARLDPKRFKLVGTRGIFREMLGALDSTLVPQKLTAMVYTALALGILAALFLLPRPDLGLFQVLPAWLLASAALLVTAALSGVLTRMTFLELSELRPARLREGLEGLTRRTVRLLLALAVGLGVLVLLLGGLRSATAWLLAPYDMPLPLVRETTANSLTVVSLVLEFALWPLFGLSFLLAPILIVEDCSIFQAVRKWINLIRQHFRSVLAYEAVAVLVAAAIALPFALPLILGAGLPLDDRLLLAASVTRAALWGCLLALPASYLIVANVFIYLNVRYETGSERISMGS
jgi:hypothetical protein